MGEEGPDDHSGAGTFGHTQIFPSGAWHLLQTFPLGHGYLGPFWFGLVLLFGHLAMFCLGSYKQAQLKKKKSIRHGKCFRDFPG